MIDTSSMTAPERREYFDSLLAAGTPTEVAGDAVGYTKRTAQEYARQDRKHIKDLALDKLSDGVPVAIQKLLHLVEHATSEAVQLNAINRLLAANNLDTIQKVQLSTLPDHDLDSQLMAVCLRACGNDEARAQVMFEALTHGHP